MKPLPPPPAALPVEEHEEGRMLDERGMYMLHFVIYFIVYSMYRLANDMLLYTYH
jgi:hypothetical protein